MKVLVDTCVWSLALRRRETDLNDEEARLRADLVDLITNDNVVMIGPVRQELLSGVRDDATFERLRERLRDFDDEPLVTDDFEAAARAHNACREAGVSGSAIDFLICGVALQRDLGVFSTDMDFERYAAVLGLELHRP